MTRIGKLLDVQWWWFHLQYYFFNNCYFGTLISGRLIEGGCLNGGSTAFTKYLNNLTVFLCAMSHDQCVKPFYYICIFVESVFWGWWQWKWCCCPSRTGKIIFKVRMSLNEFFACCSYKYCYLWWGFNSVYRGSPLAHVLHSLSTWIALSLVYAYLTWAEKRKEIDSFVKSHPYASLLLSEWKRTLQHFSTDSLYCIICTKSMQCVVLKCNSEWTNLLRYTTIFLEVKYNIYFFYCVCCVCFQVILRL